MTTPFQDFRKLVSAGTLLSTDFHAERFNLRLSPTDGVAKRVSATRRHTQPMESTGGDEQMLIESIAITLGRDPNDATGGTDADGLNIPGGLSGAPEIGLAIQSVEDADGRWFSFTGEIIASTPHTFTLGFARRIPTTTGTGAMRR